MLLLAALNIAKTGFHRGLRITDVDVEPRLKVSPAWAVRISNRLCCVAAQQNLGLGELLGHGCSQRDIGFVDIADLVERNARWERIVPIVGGLLKVARVAREPIVVLGGQELSALCGLDTGQAP